MKPKDAFAKILQNICLEKIFLISGFESSETKRHLCKNYCKNICLEKIFLITGFGSSETKRRLCKNIAKCNSIDAGKKWISWCTPWFDLILFIFGLIIICVHFLFSQNKLYLCKKGRRKKLIFLEKVLNLRPPPTPLHFGLKKLRNSDKCCIMYIPKCLSGRLSKTT